MDDPGGSGSREKRVRELEEALGVERAERRRLEASCDEARQHMHALNNALSIISTFAAELEDEVRRDSPLREGVDEIGRAAKRAASLSRKLSELLRAGGKVEPPPGHGRA